QVDKVSENHAAILRIKAVALDFHYACLNAQFWRKIAVNDGYSIAKAYGFMRVPEGGFEVDHVSVVSNARRRVLRKYFVCFSQYLCGILDVAKLNYLHPMNPTAFSIRRPEILARRLVADPNLTLRFIRRISIRRRPFNVGERQPLIFSVGELNVCCFSEAN